MKEREENPSNWPTWCLVVVFATAMAYVESAVVLYLRTMSHRLDPYQPQPLAPVAGFGWAEIFREVSTLVMLASVGALAGKQARSRFGYFLIAFGVWDIFYYVFLRPLTGWPRSLLNWDVLFLIPLPWWGPVLAPVSIAALMVVYGTLLTQRQHAFPGGGPRPLAWLCAGAGCLLALYTFMADALRVAGQGTDALRNLLPVHFNWPLFAVALVLMSSLIADVVWRSARLTTAPAR